MALSQSDYDRLTEYSVGTRHTDCRKSIPRRIKRFKRTSAMKSDPTATKAIRRVVYSTSSRGF